MSVTYVTVEERWNKWVEAAPSNPKVQEKLKWANRFSDCFASFFICPFILLAVIIPLIAIGKPIGEGRSIFTAGVALGLCEIPLIVFLALLVRTAGKHRNEILDDDGSLLESLKEREPVHVNPTLVVNPN